MTVSDGFRTVFKLFKHFLISWFLHVSGTRGKCGAFGLGGSGTWRSGRSGRSGRSEGVTTRVWCVSMFRTSCGRTQKMTPIGPIPIPFPNLKTWLFWFSLEQSCTDCFFSRFLQVFALRRRGQLSERWSTYCCICNASCHRSLDRSSANLGSSHWAVHHRRVARLENQEIGGCCSHQVLTFWMCTVGTDSILCLSVFSV